MIYPDCGTAYQRRRGDKPCQPCEVHGSPIQARLPGWVYCRVGGWHSPQIVYELVTEPGAAEEGQR